MPVTRVIGYVRVAPREGRSERPEIDEQRRAVEAECRRRGWQIVRFEQDVRSGRTLRRPGLHAALEACRAGDAQGIVVARLDRLTYSVDDLAYLMHRAVQHDFTIVAPDLDLDLETEAGAQVARVLSHASRWHPRNVGRRTRMALEDHLEHRVAHQTRGRPSSTPSDVADRIRGLRASGHTLQSICDTLNAEGVPTPRGGTHWRPTSLRAILRPRPDSESSLPKRTVTP